MGGFFPSCNELNRNKQQAVKVKVSKGLRSKSLKLEKFEVGKDRSWKKSTLQKIEVGPPLGLQGLMNNFVYNII